MRGFKSDSAARQHWGVAYDAIPKSAFALIAFHLANLAADEPDSFESISARLVEEADALSANGIMPEQHALTIRKVLGGAA